jgi:hypothetical protein
MPPIIAPGIVRVEMHFTLHGQRVMNVYHLRDNNAPVADSDLHLYANTFKNWWLTVMRPAVSNQLTLTDVTARELVDGGIAVMETADLPAAGTRDKEAFPGNVTLAVHWGTGQMGRSFHGRTYHLGLPVDQAAFSTMLAPALATLISHYDDLRTGLDSAFVAVDFGVLSTVHAGAPRVPPILTPITGVAIDSTLDSQRRRLPHRGQ